MSDGAAPGIAIVDYRMGNLRSVEKGLAAAGVEGVIVTSDPRVLARARGIVLPGVGAFRDAAANLASSGMREVLLERAAFGVPLLGICLGMQLLASVGLEDGEWEGLGLVPGTCRRIEADVKVPHMGWNTVGYPRESALFAGIPADSAFYFVHSYHVVPDEAESIIGSTIYGVPMAAAIRSGNVYGVQFHPEKSSACGLALLRGFAAIVAEVAA